MHYCGEKGAQPTTTWEKWITTTKPVISAKENKQVEKILRPKPTVEELDYPQEPICEPALPDKTTAEKRQREQRNIKRKVDWKNQCQAKEDQGSMIDNEKWDEVDNKIKRLISHSEQKEQHFSPTQPTHGIIQMHNRRTSNTTERSIQRNQK